MTAWDDTFDLVVVGSGGGGLVAALAAHDLGDEAIVLEKRPLVGGSTAMSGGVVWLPDNPIMKAEGVADSYADGMAYFEDVVGDVGPASSKERRHAYLTEGPQMVSFLQAQGVRLLRCPGYSDYYPNHDGGKPEGRSIEPMPFDARELGDWKDKIQPGMAAGLGLVVKTNELRSVQYFNRSPKAFLTAARVYARTLASRIRRQPLLTNGTSLVAQLVKISLDREIPIWTEAGLHELIVEDGRIVGVAVVKDGTPRRIEARKAVLLAAGGFAHNAEMRAEYSGDQPNNAEWSKANPGDTGEALAAAIALGAKTALMDEAWWLPSTVRELSDSTFSQARQRPGSILVDADGHRFVNESNSYVEVGKAMYARNKTATAVPCWVIVDDAYRRRYPHSKSLPGRLKPEWIESGALQRADTLDELARLCGINAQGLAETIERFNRFAVQGLDPDFGRGQSAYNRCLGDPGYTPNPALGPISKPPFYAAQLFPGDVGTCGGLLANEHAQVLEQHDQPIPGLYATGNGTATVMGRKYLGPGASIGYSMVFGYIAARHASGRATAG